MRQVIHKRGYVSKQSSKHTLTIDTEKRVKKGDRQYCTSCVCGHCENVFQNGEYSLLQADGRNYCATCTCGVCTKPLKGREKGFCKDCTCTSCDKALSQSKGYIKHKYVLLRHLKEYSNHIFFFFYCSEHKYCVDCVCSRCDDPLSSTEKAAKCCKKCACTQCSRPLTLLEDATCVSCRKSMFMQIFS